MSNAGSTGAGVLLRFCRRWMLGGRRGAVEQESPWRRAAFSRQSTSLGEEGSKVDQRRRRRRWDGESVPQDHGTFKEPRQQHRRAVGKYNDGSKKVGRESRINLGIRAGSRIYTDSYVLRKAVCKILERTSSDHRDEREELLAQATRLVRDAAPSAQHSSVFNPLIKENILLGHIRRARDLVQDMKRRGATPDSYTFVTIFSSLAELVKSLHLNSDPRFKEQRDAALETAHHYFRHLGYTNIEGEYIAPGTFFDYYGHRNIGREGLHQNVQSENTMLFNAYMKLLAAAGDISGMQIIYREMQRSKALLPDAITFQAMLRALINNLYEIKNAEEDKDLEEKIGYVEKCAELIWHGLDSGTFDPDERLVNARNIFLSKLAKLKGSRDRKVDSVATEYLAGSNAQEQFKTKSRLKELSRDGEGPLARKRSRKEWNPLRGAGYLEKNDNLQMSRPRNVSRTYSTSTRHLNVPTHSPISTSMNARKVPDLCGLSSTDLGRGLGNSRVIAGRYRSQLLQATALQTIPNKDCIALVIVVSKKTSKLAVVRNRIRRRLREAFRSLIKDESVPINPAVAYVLQPSLYFYSLEWSRVLSELKMALDGLSQSRRPQKTSFNKSTFKKIL